MSDNVNKPQHYIQSSMECIEAIEGLNLDFHQGQVLKYVYRHRHKHVDLARQLEDLEKAEFYLKRLIHFAKERIYANGHKPVRQDGQHGQAMG